MYAIGYSVCWVAADVDHVLSIKNLCYEYYVYHTRTSSRSGLTDSFRSQALANI